MNDQFRGTWDSYLDQIRKSLPPVRALGVADYFCIQGYRKVKEYFDKGELGEVGFLFPNVEMRLDIKTTKKLPINLHLLFSPHDPDHESEIERLLGQLKFEYNDRSYSCTVTELAALGKEHLGRNNVEELQARRTGANQFKITFQDLRSLFRQERWLRDNCLVAVAGSSSDGTAGLQDDDSYAATRREIERFSHIIFASTPSQVDFWLGRRKGFDRDHIERTYGSLKPCLHGSDAHTDEKVLLPALGRLCWLKGDLTFDTLRQAVIEPEERVWIGSEIPHHRIPSTAISDVSTTGTTWLKNPKVELNPGLVAIIGARGSGKTALAEILAKGSYSSDAGSGESSFLRRASEPVDHLGPAAVKLTWRDGSVSEDGLKIDRDTIDRPSEEVRYLSQHFVEQLCSAEGLATELRSEMERVVFESTDRTDRLETDSFEELLAANLRPILERRNELQDSIAAISDEIVKEENLKAQLSPLRSELAALAKALGAARADLVKLFPKGEKERATQLAQLESACAGAETRVENLRRRRRELDDLTAEVNHIRNTREPVRFREMQRRFVGASLTAAEWKAFGMMFTGDVDGVLKEVKARLDHAIRKAVEEDPQTPTHQKQVPMANWPLQLITSSRDSMRTAVGIDTEQQKKFKELNKTIAQQEIAMKRFEVQIQNAEGAETRRQGLIASRREAYGRVFETLVEEQSVLERLYAPLGRDLAASHGTLAKLQFAVRRIVDLKKWIDAGDELLDFRMDSEFRLRGTLRKRVEEDLLPAWLTGTAADVAKAMDGFRSKYAKDLMASMPTTITLENKNAWSQSVASWLYNTDHIQIEYRIEYEGVAIEQLSPGTRGIVLLLLYLAIDLQDTRPLIIDQPEENLDPNSVFEELVPQFRDARKRRQVIIVTHNANLVVNTDADQVIVARSMRGALATLPTILYDTGSLENASIRRRVCEILEGGERAFLERERRYRLRWEQEQLADPRTP